jgi:predicted Fe-S protein YdhL (DUF1289 family)
MTETPCTHPPHLCKSLRVPGRQSEILACLGCGRVKHAASPWRQPDEFELAALEDADDDHSLEVLEQARKECPHTPNFCAWLTPNVLACLGCRRVKESTRPWREASLEELDQIHRTPSFVPAASDFGDRRSALHPARPIVDALAAPAAQPVNLPLETTINRYAVASKGRGLTAIVAHPGWMDRQQALNLVAWLSVIAELEDEEIVAARRQVEGT